MRWFLAALVVPLMACASGTGMHMPKLMGPADEVSCIVLRSDGLEGTYECEIKGRYMMESVGIF